MLWTEPGGLVVKLNENSLLQERPELVQPFNISWESTTARWGSGLGNLHHLVRGHPSAASLASSQTSRGRCRILDNSCSCCHTIFETSWQVLTEASTLGEPLSPACGQRRGGTVSQPLHGRKAHSWYRSGLGSGGLEFFFLIFPERRKLLPHSECQFPML